MLIHRVGIAGTIGGGTVERDVIASAQDMVATRETLRRFERPLGPEIDQCCGGRVEIILRRIDPDEIDDHAPEFLLAPEGPLLTEGPEHRPVIVYGAGHIGQALAAALNPLPFSVTLTDTRAEMTADDVLSTPLPETLSEGAAPDAFHVVVTHSHALDLEIVTTILKRPHGFCGLIGSMTKRALFAKRLTERGLDKHEINALTCPIGVPGLRDKRPAVIAAAVAVQLLLRDAALRAATASIDQR